MSDKTFHPGGVHPPQNKKTAGDPIKDTELPRKVVMLTSQHIGAPAKCIVNKGERVVRGQIIAEAGGFVSAPVHSPITGTVTQVSRVKNAYGQPTDAVTIEANDEDHAADQHAPTPKPLDIKEALQIAPEELVKMIQDAGMVGLGGATFPTHVKLIPPPGAKAEVLIINGAECEPYLTNDDAIMRTRANDIIKGIRLLMAAAKVDRAVVGIENNKPEAIASMDAAAAQYEFITVMPLQTKYPEGGEKQLISAITGREVPSGALPISVGAIVVNVTTALACYEAICLGQPLTRRVVTVTGPDLKRPGNYRLTIGQNLLEIIEMAGGIPKGTGKVILGGPMMGRTASNLDAPTTKGVSGILLLPEEESMRRPTEPCIRCARCVEACPMGLEPYLLSTYSRLQRYDDAEANKVMNCIECGSCSYTCPSSRPLLDYIRVAKGAVGKAIRARKAAQTPNDKK